MGGACSRKPERDYEDSPCRGLSRRFCKSGSLKWWTSSFAYPSVDFHLRKGDCPSLLELCIKKINEDIDRYNTFSMLPRDISQQIFNKLVCSQRLTSVSLEAFRDCALQDLDLGEYAGVNDSWMDVISSQGSSLLSVDLSGSEVTDFGLSYLKYCENLLSLNLNYCDQISDHGLECISGLSNLTSLSLRRNDSISAQGMSILSGLVNLVKLDLERCPGIHGGLVHIQGLTKLQSLNIKWCNCITDSDMKPLSELVCLESLEISCSKVTNFGISFLKGLQKLSLLNLEGCLVTAACLDSLADLPLLSNLNLNRCNITDDGCEKFSRLENLKVLNLGFNDITDACLAHLKAVLTKLESLNLDSCRIGDEGLINLAEVGDTGLHHLSEFKNLRSLEICGGGLTDAGVKNIRALSCLMCLNLSQNCNLTDKSLESISGLTRLISLNVSNSRITNSGLQHLRTLKNLRSLTLESCKVTAYDIKKLRSTHLPNLVSFRPE
nr:F-box/LRR-repeat protein 14 isoform X13 [Arachis hypogaea]